MKNNFKDVPEFYHYKKKGDSSSSKASKKSKHKHDYKRYKIKRVDVPSDDNSLWGICYNNQNSDDNQWYTFTSCDVCGKRKFETWLYSPKEFHELLLISEEVDDYNAED